MFSPSSSAAAAVAAMRPSKLILSALCVALLAAELASAEASPPYEEVAEDARVQARNTELIGFEFVILCHSGLCCHGDTVTEVVEM